MRSSNKYRSCSTVSETVRSTEEIFLEAIPEESLSLFSAIKSDDFHWIGRFSLSNIFFQNQELELNDFNNFTSILSIMTLPNTLLISLGWESLVEVI